MGDASAKEIVSVGFENALMDGVGKVMLHRGGNGNDSTFLWQTPGVRGIWVEGGPVPDGEIVELRSSPQTSEGGEGQFVLVRRVSGVEGWAKLKNVLPCTREI